MPVPDNAAMRRAANATLSITWSCSSLATQPRRGHVGAEKERNARTSERAETVMQAAHDIHQCMKVRELQGHAQRLLILVGLSIQDPPRGALLSRRKSFTGWVLARLGVSWDSWALDQAHKFRQLRAWMRVPDASWRFEGQRSMLIRKWPQSIVSAEHASKASLDLKGAQAWGGLMGCHRL